MVLLATKHEPYLPTPQPQNMHTYYHYLRKDDQAELTWVAGYMQIEIIFTGTWS